MRPHLKVALVTLALICMLAWMRDITVSNKDSIENGSAVETVEDLEHSTITDLLSEMEKGSMQREFSIEKKEERTWQVASFDFYITVVTATTFTTTATGITSNIRQVASLAHFLWIGSVIPAKYVNNINNFCRHNPEYQVLRGIS